MHRGTSLFTLLALPTLACSSGETLTPIPDPDPVDVTVVVQIAGLSTDADGFDLWISGRKIARLGVGAPPVDSVTTEVLPGEHDLFFTEVDENCFVSNLQEQQPFFLPGNRVEAEVFCRPKGSVQIAYSVEGELESSIQILSENGFETFRPGGASEWHPSWSPDGSRMALVSDRDGNPEIYLADFEAETDVRLTDHGGEDLDPAWSPDGSRIAFISTRGGIGRDVWVAEIESGDVTRLTATVRPESDPDWSPDNQWIVFSRNDEVIETHLDGSADTTYVDRIYRVGAEGGATAFMMTGGAPHWGSDGRIYFALPLGNALGGGTTIGSRDPEGANLAHHTGLSPALRTQPHLSPDGEYVIYANADPGGLRIFATHLPTGDIRRVSTGVAGHRAPAWRPGTFVERDGGG